MARLIIVTIALAVVAVVLRRRVSASPKVTQLKVTARTALHRNAVIAVVEIEGRRLLVGAASQQICLLTELEPVPVESRQRVRPELPSELPTVLEDSPALLERVRRATSRTLDPVTRAQRGRTPEQVT